MFTNALDKTDIKILKHLQADASLSNSRLSELINLSPSQCHRRVKRLEEEGYVDRYVALLNQRKMDMNVHAIVIIKAKDLMPQSKQAFREAMMQFPMVTECWAIAGDKDILLKVGATSLEAFSNFLSEKIFSMDIVGSAETYLLLENMKYTTELPLPD